MFKIYENHELADLKFKFKLDLNPLTNNHEPHIFIRHLIEPEQVIVAYLNISTKSYNKTYKRWEAYSETDDLYIYFMELSKDMILIITAFKI
jgi:hypothetical protein